MPVRMRCTDLSSEIYHFRQMNWKSRDNLFLIIILYHHGARRYIKCMMKKQKEHKKKKVLFVMESLRIGGAEKSLITTLSTLDYDKYDVDLLLFRQGGPFLSQVPEQVHLIKTDTVFTIQGNFKTAWLVFLKQGKIRKSLNSLAWLCHCAVSKYIRHEEEYIGWNYLTHIFRSVRKEYDTAVGFLEKKTIYYVIDHVKARTKIGYMHTDYDAIPHNEELDRKYLNKLNYLVCVSEPARKTMVRHFPFLADKAIVIPNMISRNDIKKKAEDSCPELEKVDSDVFKIVTVARLTPPKKIDGAVGYLDSVRKSGINAQWFVIGDGEEREHLQQMIADRNLGRYFHLVGARPNPYPFMLNCDLYVQPSRWEGYGITVAEAKALCRPIVASDIPEFQEQIQNGVTGYLCHTDEEIIQMILYLACNKQERDRLSNNLKKSENLKNEIKKLESIL